MTGVQTCALPISAKDQKELLAELEKRGIFLLCDDVYAELAFRDPYKPASKESQYAVVINSWSKSLALPGWRIGFVHTRHRLLFKKILSAHQFLSTCANAPAQALMVAVLSRPALYAKTLNGFRSTYERRLKTHCKSLDLDCPAGGFYLFPRIKSRNSESFANKLLKTHNLLVVPGSYFGREGSQYLRVSLATPDRVLKKAIPLLKEQLSVGNGGAR